MSCFVFFPRTSVRSCKEALLDTTRSPFVAGILRRDLQSLRHCYVQVCYVAHMRSCILSVKNPWSQMYVQDSSTVVCWHCCPRHGCVVWLRNEWPHISHQYHAVPQIPCFWVIRESYICTCWICFNDHIMHARLRERRLRIAFVCFPIRYAFRCPLGLWRLGSIDIREGRFQILCRPPFGEFPRAQVIKPFILASETVQFLEGNAECIFFSSLYWPLRNFGHCGSLLCLLSMCCRLAATLRARV